MARRASPANPPGPRCGAGRVVQNGRARAAGRRGRGHGCARSCGPTLGPPLYRLHTPAAEVARRPRVVMRRGRRSAAEEHPGGAPGHQSETLGRGRRAAAAHAEALTAALARERHRTATEGDAFWSCVRSSAQTLAQAPPRRPGWGPAGAA